MNRILAQTLGERVYFSPSMMECVERSDVVVITTPWDEFSGLGSERVGRRTTPRVVIDCWRILNIESADGVEYVPLGIGGITED